MGGNVDVLVIVLCCVVLGWMFGVEDRMGRWDIRLFKLLTCDTG